MALIPYNLDFTKSKESLKLLLLNALFRGSIFHPMRDVQNANIINWFQTHKCPLAKCETSLTPYLNDQLPSRANDNNTSSISRRKMKMMQQLHSRYQKGKGFTRTCSCSSQNIFSFQKWWNSTSLDLQS